MGRVGDYPIMAAKAGMIAYMFCDSGRTAKMVVPFGGREPRLGTNPISIAVPSDLEAPFYLDMATSAVAAGKIALAVARGEEIPTGWIIDADDPVDDTVKLQGFADARRLALALDRDRSSRIAHSRLLPRRPSAAEECTSAS